MRMTNVISLLNTIISLNTIIDYKRGKSNTNHYTITFKIIDNYDPLKSLYIYFKTNC